MRDKTFVVWVVLGAVLLAVLNLPDSFSRYAKAALREGLAPLQGVVSGIARRTQESFRLLRGIGDLIGENQQMSAEMVRLRGEVRELQSLERENNRLREQLGFLQKSERLLIPCEVIARDITGWWQTIRLSKGSSHGIERDMAVVTSDGLVGKTIDVSSRTSDVMLISDPGCRVSAKIARSGSFGIVAGAGPGESGQAVCKMDFVNKNLPVLPGDEVVTSGLGGVFPAGLLLGYVESVGQDKSGLYQHAEVLPGADLGSLTYVFVVVEHRDPLNEYLRRLQFGEGAEL